MRQRILIVMLDGFGWDYWECSGLPHLTKMAAQGFVKKGRAVFPTLTNANNVSIACGCAPLVHGVTANYHYNPDGGFTEYIESSDQLTAPTLFERVAALGGKSALFTCKTKTMGILGNHVAIGVSPKGRNDLSGASRHCPPSVYSADANYWLFETAFSVLRSRKDIDLFYIHTTDFPMHHWGPEERESQMHLLGIDSCLEEVSRIAPDTGVIVTADHGMKTKQVCINLEKVCESRGVPLALAVSPVANRMMAHHGGYGGVSYVYLKSERDREKVRVVLLSTQGVDEVLEGAEAAGRFKLPARALGDFVVLADARTVFGPSEEEIEDLPKDYRGHGSLYEADVPLIAYNIAIGHDRLKRADYNYEMTKFLFTDSACLSERLETAPVI